MVKHDETLKKKDPGRHPKNLVSEQQAPFWHGGVSGILSHRILPRPVGTLFVSWK